MALQGCYKCLQYLVVVFNLIYWLLGIVIVSGSLVFMTHSTSYLLSTGQNTDEYLATMYSLIGIGAFLVILGFLGCCGAIRESPYMLSCFFTLLLTVVVAELAGGTTLWTHAEPIKAMVKKQLSVLMQDEYGRDEFFTARVDEMQQSFHCCGINSPKDWAQSKFNGYQRRTEVDFKEVGLLAGEIFGVYEVPRSCCVSNVTCEVSRKMEFAGAIAKQLYQTGCLPAIWEAITLHAAVAGGVMAMVGALQVIGLLFTLLLCCAVRRDVYKD